MTDRELLEKAAKAAGMETMWDQPRGARTGVLRARLPGSGDAFPYWNPLQDDGDALRLAVKLRITPMLRALGCDASDAFMAMAYERYRDDPYAATRRAIVRAAAAMAPQER